MLQAMLHAEIPSPGTPPTPLPTCWTKSVGSVSMGSSRATASFDPVPAQAMPTAMAEPYLDGRRRGSDRVGRGGHAHLAMSAPRRKHHPRAARRDWWACARAPTTPPHDPLT